MRQSTKTKNLKIFSIDTETNIINQQTLAITEHNIDKSYLILSKNDFGIKQRVNAGIFNRKTNFIVSEKNSLIFYDSKNDLITTKNISDITINDFIIYMPPYSYFYLNDEIIDSIIFNDIEIKLTFELGYVIGQLFTKQIHKIPDQFKYIYEFFDYAIQYKKINNNEITSINKSLLINTNINFLIGILLGSQGAFDIENKNKLILKNMNIYSIINILNTLSASYSIRKIQKNKLNYFYIRYKLPNQYKNFVDIQYLKTFKNLFRKDYLFENNKLILTNSIIIDNEHLDDFKKFVNKGFFILLPVKDFKFIPVENQIGYDFVTEGRDSGMNYIYAGLPLLKNSDGDILAVAAIHTPEAAKEADRKFGIKIKENHLSFLTGKPRSWITNDAVLGLYEFTK